MRESRSHAAAVDIVVQLQRQTLHPERFAMTDAPVDLYRVLRTLAAKRIPFVLIGAHGISGWTGRPRNTLDIDLLVKAGRNYTRAVKALRELYPQMEVVVFPTVTAFFPPGSKQSVIDVVLPHRGDLEQTAEKPAWTEVQGLRYRVPTLEEALASKYGAMITPSRSPGKRAIDAGDFAFMVGHASETGRRPINRAALRALGEKVWPGGGGAEILRLVEQVHRGEIPHPDSIK